MKSFFGKLFGSKGEAAPEAAAEANAPRRMLGTYELGKKLGDGAMGAVYLARETMSGREVAVKTMALSEAFEPEILADIKSRFFREAEIIERLDHPNIVAVYDMGEEDELAYISMELLHGRDLDGNTKPGNLLPYREVLHIIASVADALGYAHAQNVVHRDIKPGNIMYDPAGGTIKVMDFGVSRITTESRTKVGVVLGTPYYMSPEQLRGLKIGPASDLFSLGVSLYQMLAGNLPFTGKTAMEVMGKIAKEPHVDILTIRPELPKCVGGIVDRSMAKEIEQRFQSGHEMAEAIRACLASI
jgi:eukaryotic-like serine/threonine-protein kinase